MRQNPDHCIAMQREKLIQGAKEWYLRDNPIQAVHGPRAVKRVEYQKQARMHEANRQETVAETLALVGVLAQRKFLSGHEAVTVGPVISQWASGEGTVVGAHCIPGWMRFNGSLLHDSQEWTPDRLVSKGIKAIPFSRKIWNLGARVDMVDVTLNKTDSDLERMSSGRGLKPALGYATQLLMTRIQHRRPDRVDTLYELVADAVENYRVRAVFIYEERIDGYQQKRSKADSEASAHSFEDRQLVAETYYEVLRQSTFRAPATTPSGFQSVVQEVLDKV